MGWNNDGDCEIGAMLINWEKRSVEMHGIDGCTPGMTCQEVLAFLDKQNRDGQIDRFAIVFWHEPRQFCLYGRDEFVTEVCGPHSDTEAPLNTSVS